MEGRSEPTVISGSSRWRLGKLELEHKDKGSKLWSHWQINYGNHYRLLEFSSLKFGFGFYLFDDHTSLHVFGLWIQLPLKAWREPQEIVESWGFTYLDNALHLRWGQHSKIVYMPWDFVHIDSKHKVLLADGRSWEIYPRWTVGEPNPDERLNPLRWKGEYPYRYMLPGGTVQEVTATVMVEMRQWRRRWLPEWFPWFKSKKIYIDVKFSDELGERAGSWKGGCIGCSYEMKPDERPVDTLRRMERERRFR